MRNEDNDCIRYLMKEMDPSEELLMERAMMEDEDLLIEVESMRQTLTKLDKLPQKNPPSELTDRILEQAVDHVEKKREAQKSFKPAYKYAVAATLALTLTAGGTWFYMDQGGKSSSQSAAPSKAQITSGNEGFLFGDEGIMPFQATSAEEQDPEIDPWIDRNDILQFEDQMMNNRGDFNALLERSTQKLKLINNTTINKRPAKSIQLTGTGN